MKIADLYEWVRYILIIMATGFWLAVFCLAMGCGGGGSASAASSPPQSAPAVVPAPPTYNYRDFIPRESVTRYFQGVPLGQWQLQMLTGEDYDILWGKSWEEHRVIDYAGEKWLIYRAFRDTDTGARYTVSTSRNEIDRGDGRGWQSLPPGEDFGPYVPLKLTGPVTVRQWGTVGGMAFFWISTFTPQPSVYNSCWMGAGDSTRPGIRQQEAWWDKNAGWFTVRGAGPLGPDGVPLGTATYTDWFQTLGAYGAGWIWQGLGTCLIR